MKNGRDGNKSQQNTGNQISDQAESEKKNSLSEDSEDGLSSTSDLDEAVQAEYDIDLKGRSRGGSFDSADDEEHTNPNQMISFSLQHTKVL